MVLAQLQERRLGSLKRASLFRPKVPAFHPLRPWTFVRRQPKGLTTHSSGPQLGWCLLLRLVQCCALVPGPLTASVRPFRKDRAFLWCSFMIAGSVLPSSWPLRVSVGCRFYPYGAVAEAPFGVSKKSIALPCKAAGISSIAAMDLPSSAGKRPNHALQRTATRYGACC